MNESDGCPACGYRIVLIIVASAAYFDEILPIQTYQDTILLRRKIKIISPVGRYSKRATLWGMSIGPCFAI
jgi:hypothetical protein